ncbi:CHAT domain-containing protein, partial [Xylogone sp. PMI_703]
MDFVVPATSTREAANEHGGILDASQNPGRLDLLDSATQLFHQYQQTGEIELLKNAIRRASYAAQLTPSLERHTRRLEILRSYHDMLHEHVRLTRNVGELTDAILILNEALDFVPEQDPYIEELRDRLHQMWASRPAGANWRAGKHVPNHDHLADAHGPSRRSEILSGLSEVFWKLYEGPHKMDELSKSCQILRKAIQCTPKDDPELVYRLGKMAFMLEQQYDRTGVLEQLNESICCSQQALDAAPKDYAGDLQAGLLEGYANGLQYRSKRFGSIEDLTVSIDLTMKAIAVAPPGRSKVVYLNNLGNRLENRYNQMGRVADLKESIQVAEEALELAARYHLAGTLLAGTQHNLGVKLLKLATRDTQTDHLQQAINLIGQAVLAAPSPAYVPAAWLASLSGAFRARYWQEKDEENLNQAIRYAGLALANTAKGHPEGPLYLYSMAWLLRERAERTKGHHDLMEAISLPPWENKAMDCFLKCLNCRNGDAVSRMVAGAQLMSLFQKRGEFSSGIEVGIHILEILHSQNTRSLSRDDQEHTVSQFSDVAVETCSLSLQAEHDPAEALELLESGRGAILGLLIENRSDISQLAAVYPKEAELFGRLRDEIRRPISIDLEVSSRQELVSQRDRSVLDLDQCLRDIRALPGQDRFLRGPTAEQLRQRASEGPIVLVSIADLRSDAIMVSHSTIKTLPLPELTKSKVIEWIRQEPTRYKRSEKGKKNRAYSEFLKWLWSACVEPILQGLSITRGQSPASLPRIWWIGAGLASFLPFHAAGDHSQGSVENTYSRAISSYTPTIKALGYARERVSFVQTLSTDTPELLAVLMPSTPDVENEAVGDLKVTEEFSKIQNIVAPKFIVRLLLQPSCEEVLAQLSQCDMAHFACHGVSDLKDPSNSYLILQQPGQGPDSAPTAEKLTVEKISDAMLGRARIAYLSACSTAENRAEQLADEVIHLASGFQVAGFPHVIGALWPSDDEVSVKVAETFYQHISRASPFDDGAVALALRDAVIEVRARWPRQPLLWAQYIHIG